MANVVPVLARDGQKRGEVTLSASLFGIEPNEHVMYEAVRAYLANQRAGTASTKGRSDVRGGGRKPWRQKGTGRARIGSTRVSHWVGGGLAFGPKPHDMSLKLPKKIKRLALRSALSAKASADEIKIIEDFELSKVSTSEMASVLEGIGVGGTKTLLVLSGADRKLLLSARNIPTLAVVSASSLTAYHLLGSDVIVMTESALAKVEEVFGQ
jgi:large subunit ribosomal protein L4